MVMSTDSWWKCFTREPMARMTSVPAISTKGP